MGDRYFQPRHPSLDLLLKRLPGIGHNGGPPLDEPTDMSFIAWAWRKAVKKAWETPPREVALRRLARAERLGLTYRDFTAAILDTGVNLSTALLPLHHLAELGADGRLQYHQGTVEAARRFQGRLLIIVDVLVCGDVSLKGRKALLAHLQADGVTADAMLVLPLRTAETDAKRAQRLRQLLMKHRAMRKECFWLGTTPAEGRLAEQAGLGWFKPVAQWYCAEKQTAATEIL